MRISTRPEVVIVIPFYGDESSDETKERVFAIGGLVGTAGMWTALEEKWSVRIGDIPFHANDCDSDKGDYESTPHEENKALYRDLTIILAESGIGGYGVAIDLIAEYRIFPNAPREYDYYTAFAELMMDVRSVAVANDDKIKLTFDMRKESEFNTGILYEMFIQMPEFSPHFVTSIEFESSRQNVRIQAADLFAREVMKSLDNEIGPVKRLPRKSWLALEATERFQKRVIGEEFLSLLRLNMREIGELIEFTDNKYPKWLISNGLQVNATNRLRYLREKIWKLTSEMRQGGGASGKEQ